jgi:hypothetical protein
MWYHCFMSKIEKLIASMKQNPEGDWLIDDLKRLAQKFEIEFRQPGSSHVTFRTLAGQKLTIPAHKPIKPIYVKMFIALIETRGVH